MTEKSQLPPLSLNLKKDLKGLFAVDLYKNRGKNPSDFKISFAIIEHEDGKAVKFTRRQMECLFGNNLVKEKNEQVGA